MHHFLTHYLGLMRCLLLVFTGLGTNLVVAQERDAEIARKGLENVLLSEALQEKCQSLPPHIYRSVQQQAAAYAQATKIAEDKLAQAQQKARDAISDQDCNGNFVRNWSIEIIANYGLRNNVASLELNLRCKMFEQPVIDVLYNEMISYARRAQFDNARLERLQGQIRENVSNLKCTDPQVTRLKRAVLSAYKRSLEAPTQQDINSSGSEEQVRAQLAMLVAAQEAQRKCKSLTSSEVGDVNQHLRDMSRKLSIDETQINQIRKNISGIVSRQQCTGPEISGVIRWIRCGFPGDLICR